MGDIIIGNKEEFRDRSRKVVINLSFEPKKESKSESKPKMDSDSYTEYEEVESVEQQKSDQQPKSEEQNVTHVAAGSDEKPPKLDMKTPESKLILLLSRDWFNGYTTNATLYTPSWRSKYIKALMKEFGTRIAQGWAGKGTRNKQNLIKGHVLGALKNAGVIKGSNTEIAREASKIGTLQTGNEAGRIANYIGHRQGNDESTQNPYLDWTKKYVEEIQ